MCDFDKNGKPDLLVGSENGRIYFIKHEDTNQFTKEQMTARPPKRILTPRFPGLISEGFIFNKAPHKECHASTIVQTSRGFVAAWTNLTGTVNTELVALPNLDFLLLVQNDCSGVLPVPPA